MALTLQAPQRPQLIAKERVRAWRPILHPPHVQHRAIEVDLVPAQVADLSGPEPMPEGDQDHGRSLHGPGAEPSPFVFCQRAGARRSRLRALHG